MRLKLLVVMATMAAVAFVATHGSFAQPRKRGGFDPDALFDHLAKGKEFIVIAELPDGGEPLKHYALLQDITNGLLDRAQFADFFEWYRQNGFGQYGDKYPNFNPRSAPLPKESPELEFKRMDVDRDGFLNKDEMPERLKRELTRWDRDKDGRINLEEFKKFYQTRLEESFGWRRVNPAVQEWERRPNVHRADKLPEDLPEWFGQLDEDGDGQISLAEWLKGGNVLEDFARYDRNDDGFLTPAEVLRIETVAMDILGKDGPAVSRKGKADIVKKINDTLAEDDPIHPDPAMRGLRAKVFEVQLEAGKKY